MTANMVNFLISLVDCTCILLIAVYIITRSQGFYEILKAKDQPQKKVILILFFTVISAYGVFISTTLEHSIISVSIVGPIAAAMICGFWVGTGAGLLGAVIGILVHGSASPAAILLAGVMAGIFNLRKTKKTSKVIDAAVFSFCYALLAELAIFIFQPAETRVSILIPASALICVLGVAGIVFVMEKLVEERQTSAAKELIDSELRIAGNIQMSIVPKTFPPLPNLPELEVFAVLKPAKEIGGDFYDFFLIDADHFFFAIGDVSSKGMPAALFMAVSRTLLKANAEPNVAPDTILKRVNDILCRENDSSMFVTVFCGIINIHSGKISYSNAGHYPPYLYRKGEKLESVIIPEGMALGINENAAYKQNCLILKPGDAIIAYTDGVNEAMNRTMQQYNMLRLEQIIKSDSSTSSRSIASRIHDDVEHFTNGAEQSDDITILSLTYTPEQH